MAFIRIPGIPGKVYQPQGGGTKKHNCKDCFFCQMCSDERCLLCLKRKSGKCRKKSKSKK
ncbi:MAG: hypothetical protein WC496_03050 [Phycisphaerae bacterium]